MYYKALSIPKRRPALGRRFVACVITLDNRFGAVVWFTQDFVGEEHC